MSEKTITVDLGLLMGEAQELVYDLMEDAGFWKSTGYQEFMVPIQVYAKDVMLIRDKHSPNKITFTQLELPNVTSQEKTEG